MTEMDGGMPARKPIRVPKFQTERKFSAWFSKLLRKEFGEEIVVVNVTGGGYGTNGVSDLIICFFGIFFAVELKMNGKELTKLQLRFSMQIDRAGGRTLSPVTPDKALDALDYFRAIKQYKMGRQVMQSLNENEAKAVVDEGRVDATITECDRKHLPVVPCLDENCHLKGDAKMWSYCQVCTAETGQNDNGLCVICGHNSLADELSGGDLESTGFIKPSGYDD